MLLDRGPAGLGERLEERSCSTDRPSHDLVRVHGALRARLRQLVDRGTPPLRGDDPKSRPPRNLLIKVRAGTPAAFEERLIKRLQAAAPDWSFEVTRLTQMRDDSIRFAVAPLIAIGLVAAFLMLMVALGLFGVLWQAVTQRTRELGLRRVKGASKVNVRRQILGEIGVMTGLALAVGLLVVVQFPLLNIIYFVDLRVYLIAFILSAATIVALTLLCGWYPSHVATRIEPAEALRYE